MQSPRSNSKWQCWMWDSMMLAVTLWGAVIGGLGWGGTLETGQADPLRWWLAILLAMGVLAGVARFRRRPVARRLVIGGVGACVAVGVLCGVASASWPRWPIPHMPTAPTDKPGLAIATGLDLFWGSPNGALDAMRVAPALDVLADNFHIVRLDQVGGAQLAPQPYLLLAQPRLLSPQELVALDGWVRGGGKAVILADPMLLWPTALPLGDRRRAPVTSLLDPLLAHWGLVLEPAGAGAGAGEGVARHVLSSGALLTVAGASRFTVRAGGPCRTIEGGLIALCRIGRGQVRLIADADLLNDRLWLAAAGRTSDTMALLAGWLRAPIAPQAPLPHPVAWVRSDATLIAGLRWALLFGTVWAMIGALWIGRVDSQGG